MNLVDSHCHLDHVRFAGDLEDVLGRARKAGVTRFVAIGTGEGPPDLETGIRLSEQHEGFFATIGVHPHDASKATETTFEKLRELAKHPKVIAVGEVGLDYHYDFSPRQVQTDVFVQQLEIARLAGLPVAIHTREAWNDTVKLIREYAGGATGIMHCFTGGIEEARQALDLGFHLSFGGILTFPNSQGVRDAARFVPTERLLVETDAPYLAPAPHRGKRNEPMYMLETVRTLAGIRDTDVTEIAAVTSANFEALCLPRVSVSEYTREFQ